MTTRTMTTETDVEVTCPDGHEIQGSLQRSIAVSQIDGFERMADGRLLESYGGYTEFGDGPLTIVNADGVTRENDDDPQPGDLFVCVAYDEFRRDQLLVVESEDDEDDEDED
jgi:hypothetical protein